MNGCQLSDKETSRCVSRVLPGGVPRVVNVLAARLKKVLDEKREIPTVAVRPVGDMQRVRTYDHAEILGPSAIYLLPDAPLPRTDGRGVAALWTEAPIRVFRRGDR